MLMDAFMAEAPVERKHRVHLHAFAKDCHAFLHTHRGMGSRQALEKLGDELAAQYRLLAFDEFRVADAYDAAVLGHLFKRIFEVGVVVVATSNMPPSAFVQSSDNSRLGERISHYCKVIDLGSDMDYRTRAGVAVADAGTHHRGLEIVSDDPLAAWRDAIPPTAQPCCVDVGYGRALTVPYTWWPATGAFPFAALCGDGAAALGASDYLALSRRFQLLLLGDVPVLGRESRGPEGNAARRFASLLDVCYDRNVSVALTTRHKGLFDLTAKEPDDDWLAAMQRARSRWAEMSRFSTP